MGLALGELEQDRQAAGIDKDVNLGGQAASASSKRMAYPFSRAPFLLPPAAERVARIEVESTIQVSRSM